MARDRRVKDRGAARRSSPGRATMWELIERRAELDPDRHHAHRRARPDPDLRRVPRPGRAGRRRPPGDGGRTRARRSRGSSRPVSTRSCCRRRSAGSARVQNPIIHLYREREVGFALRQTGAEFFAIPGEFRGFDYRRARRAGHRGPRPRRRASSSSTTGSPRATRRRCRRPRPGSPPTRRRSAGSTTRPGARPTPRACATPTRR